MAQNHRQTDMVTLWPTRPSGAELVKKQNLFWRNIYKLWLFRPTLYEKKKPVSFVSFFIEPCVYPKVVAFLHLIFGGKKTKLFSSPVLKTQPCYMHLSWPSEHGSYTSIKSGQSAFKQNSEMHLKTSSTNLTITSLPKKAFSPPHKWELYSGPFT